MDPNLTSNSVTSLTLLARLRSDPTDQRGWEVFVQRYSKRIYGWCRKWGLQEADAHDVTQNVLLALSKQMRSFEYKPSGRFRSWLRTVAYRSWVNYIENRMRDQRIMDKLQDRESLFSEEARMDFLDQLEEQANRELLEEAMKNVQTRVKRETWESFRLMVFEQLTAAAAAERLNIKEGTVFVARSRIQKMLLKEMERLDAEALA